MEWQRIEQTQGQQQQDMEGAFKKAFSKNAPSTEPVKPLPSLASLDPCQVLKLAQALDCMHIDRQTFYNETKYQHFWDKNQSGQWEIEVQNLIQWLEAFR